MSQLRLSIGDWARGRAQGTQSAPETRRERQRRGEAAQASGASLEAAVARALREAGAWVVQVPAPVQLLGREAASRLLVEDADRRLVVGRLESPCAPDLVGVSAGGLALAIECKSTQTQEGTWPIGKRLAGHQGAALRACEAAGGAGALVLRWGGALHLLPWVELDPAPRQSLRRAEVERWGVGAGWAAHLESREAWMAWRGRR